MFKSKIHRATVTEANVDYEGSITVDQDLLDAAEIRDYEWVNVWNVTRGTRLATYALPGERGSGVICLNGAAAHLVEIGDLVIIATEAYISQSELDDSEWAPTVVLVDENNKVKDSDHKESEKNNLSRKDAHRLLDLGDWESADVKFAYNYEARPERLDKAIEMWCEFTGNKIVRISGNDDWFKLHFAEEYDECESWEYDFYEAFPDESNQESKLRRG